MMYILFLLSIFSFTQEFCADGDLQEEYNPWLDKQPILSESPKPDSSVHMASITPELPIAKEEDFIPEDSFDLKAFDDRSIASDLSDLPEESLVLKTDSPELIHLNSQIESLKRDIHIFHEQAADYARFGSILMATKTYEEVEKMIEHLIYMYKKMIDLNPEKKDLLLEAIEQAAQGIMYISKKKSDLLLQPLYDSYKPKQEIARKLSWSDILTDYSGSFETAEHFAPSPTNTEDELSDED